MASAGIKTACSSISLHSWIQCGAAVARTSTAHLAVSARSGVDEVDCRAYHGRPFYKSVAVIPEWKGQTRLVDRSKRGRSLLAVTKTGNRRLTRSVEQRPFTTSSKVSQEPTSFQSILPPIVHTSLSASFPSIVHPTLTQTAMIQAILDGRDCFVRDRTGMGKTFALVLAVLSLLVRPVKSTPTSATQSKQNNRKNVGPTARPPNGPRYLILLPNPSLVGQVERWISTVTADWKENSNLVLAGPDPESLRERMESGDGTEPILIATPSALLPLISPSHQHPGSPILDLSNITLVAIDEVDSLIRPLPGRFSNTRDHSFWRHPPKAVEVLGRVLGGRNNGQERKVQTVWMSATINAPMRAWVWQQGWVRRGEECVTIDGRNDEGVDEVGLGLGGGGGGGGVRHHCVVVEPVTGKLVDAMAETRTPPLPINVLKEVGEQTSTAPGRIHPFIVEALATLWATASAGPRQHHAIVLPPEGTSVPALVENLSSLGVTASTPNDPEGLVIVSRSQVRGLDLPDLDTVYILGGLGVDGMSKKMKASGGVAEREREYWHMAGRVGRLRGAVDVMDGNLGDFGDRRQAQRVVTIVLGGSDEHRAMERFMKDERSGMKVERWPEGLS